MAGAATTLLIDGHTHLYDVYDDRIFLDSALANFAAAAARLTIGAEWRGCLLLSETARDNAFERLRADAGRQDGGAWSFRRTLEDGSLIAERDGEDRLILVAGRQLSTAEGLEVLALCCPAEFQDGLPLAVALDAVRDRDGVAVLPWGFGKWWLARGRVMRSFLCSPAASSVYLGDNAGRPAILADPPLFKVARRRGIFVLPGSDTLPFAAEATRVAGYGFLVRGDVDIARPAWGVKALLKAQTTQPQGFGRRQGMSWFARHQGALMLRRRARAPRL